MIPTHPLLWPVGAAALLLTGAGAYFASIPAKATASAAPIEMTIPAERLEPRLKVETARTALREVNSRLTALNDTKKILETEARDWDARRTRAVQKMDLAFKSPQLTKLQQEVERQRSVRPDWRAMGIGNSQPLIDAWTNSGTESKVAAAVALIRGEVQRLTATKAGHEQSAARTATKRRDLVVAVIARVDDVEKSLASRLDVISTLESSKDALIAAVDDLLSASMRARAGVSFTNSLGMQLVWISDETTGGFWIGRQEVTKKQFEQILPGSAPDCAADENGLLYRVLWQEAVQFCQALTTKEHTGTPAEAGQVAPKDYDYQLPTYLHRNIAKGQTAALGLLNFDSGVTEFLADPCKANFRAVWGRSPGGGLLLKGFPEGPFLVADSRNFSTSGPASEVTKAGGNRLDFDGRIGFRIVLLPRTSP